ncbi:hypothetical protein DSECCO2_504790 [anaerobic digester metagenome]
MCKCSLVDQRHDIHDVDPELIELSGNLYHMLIINSRYKHGIDLDNDSCINSRLYSLKLVFDLNLGSFDSSVDFSVIYYMVHYFCLDFGIDCVYRNCQSGNPNTQHVRKFFREHKPVCAHAEGHLRKFLPYKFKCLKCFIVSQRVARSCNCNNFDERIICQDLPGFFKGFPRTQDFTCNSRTALVYAVKFPYTKITLDVALGGYSKVDSPKLMLSIFIVTGVFGDLSADFLSKYGAFIRIVYRLIFFWQIFLLRSKCKMNVRFYTK